MGTWTGPRSHAGRLDEQIGQVIALAAEHGVTHDLVVRKRSAILERVRRMAKELRTEKAGAIPAR